MPKDATQPKARLLDPKIKPTPFAAIDQGLVDGLTLLVIELADELDVQAHNVGQRGFNADDIEAIRAGTYEEPTGWEESRGEQLTKSQCRLLNQCLRAGGLRG